MKQFLLSLLIAIVAIPTNAQVRVGEWRDHFSLRNGVVATSSSSKAFVAAANGLFWFDLSTREIGKITTVNGLSDVGISAIMHSPYTDLLVVGYENGNIDLVFPNRTDNIPFIRNKLMQGSKRINHFKFADQNRLLVSTGFGIVEMDIDRKEIRDTYFIGDAGSNINVSSTEIHQGNILAATDIGLMSAPVDHPNLIHFATWVTDANLPTGSNPITGVASFKGAMYAIEHKANNQPDILWENNGSGWNSIWTRYNTISSINTNGSRLVFSSPQGLGVISNPEHFPSEITSYPGLDNFNPAHAVVNSTSGLVVADQGYGMCLQLDEGWVQANPNGPRHNRAYHIAFADDEVLVAGGSRTSAWNNRFFSTAIYSFANHRWRTIFDFDTFDPIRTLESPNASNEFYVATWGHGILKFKDRKKVEQYNQNNSTLETIESAGSSYCRISDIAFDRHGNLWAANTGVRNALSVKLAGDEWVGFPFQSQVGGNRTGDIEFSHAGHLWLSVPNAGGFFVLDPGSNPAQINENSTLRIGLTDREGGSLPDNVASFAFDYEGSLWVGTTQGVVVSYNPDRVFDPGAFFAQQIKIPDLVEGMAVYLLDNETVTSIAVDGGNRKWFGTSQSGVYQYSTDGYTTLKHFTVDNSPLPSNTIQHLNIHPKTGEVFISTDRGMVSYRGDASAPNETFGMVYAFPNPVRPDYTGDITITGLIRNTIVKITDSAGNLVYETRSQGGLATWDGRTINGNRVATGVYLIFCADDKGEQSAVGKLMFIR